MIDDGLKKLLKRSLGLDVDSIPMSGATLSDDEIARIKSFIDATLKIRSASALGAMARGDNKMNNNIVNKK